MDDVIFINYDTFYNTKKEILPDLRLQEKIKSISSNLNVLDNINNINKNINNSNINNKYKKKKCFNTFHPKNLNEYKKEDKKDNYKRKLNSLINKINGNNYFVIMNEIVSIIDNNNTLIEKTEIISTLIEKAYNSRQYTSFLLGVLKESMKLNNDFIMSKIINSHENNIELFDNKIEDIIHLSSINSYNEFCDCNRKKKDLLNWGNATIILINEKMLENFTHDDYFDFIYFKLCEYISYDKNVEILIDLIVEFVNEMPMGEKYKYRKTISNFYDKNIKQKMNKRCQFKFESII